jgi:phage shock protein A
MFKVVKKWWKYLGAKFNRSFEKNADPAVQLEQALSEAQAQHRRLKEQAANVIANQKQSELRLNSKMAELEKLNANTRQALMMADDAALVRQVYTLADTDLCLIATAEITLGGMLRDNSSSPSSCAGRWAARQASF